MTKLQTAPAAVAAENRFVIRQGAQLNAPQIDAAAYLTTENDLEIEPANLRSILQRLQVAARVRLAEAARAKPATADRPSRPTRMWLALPLLVAGAVAFGIWHRLRRVASQSQSAGTPINEKAALR